MERFISYEGLPINAGGAHSLGKKSAAKVYEETLAFLSTYTNAQKPRSVELIFYSSQNKSYKTWPHLWQLVKRFGIPTWKRWNLIKTTQHFFTWNIRPGKFDEAFSILADFEHLPDNEYGPLVLACYWQFHFIDPVTKLELPRQHEIPVIDFRLQNSRTLLRLGRRSTISVWFAWPFEELDESSRQYLTGLSRTLPFKPSGKHWRLWKKSKAGNWNPSIIDFE